MMIAKLELIAGNEVRAMIQTHNNCSRYFAIKPGNQVSGTTLGRFGGIRRRQMHERTIAPDACLFNLLEYPEKRGFVSAEPCRAARV